MAKARKTQRYILIGGAGLLLFGFIMCCSGIRFPFFSANSKLNGHFTADFGITLPSSAVVDRAYRVAYRDQEHVFELHMAPADILVFMKALKAAAADRGYTQQEREPAQIHPLYGRPTWWNDPPIPDPETHEIFVKDSDHITAGYQLLYSATTGKMYVVWGEF